MKLSSLLLLLAVAAPATSDQNLRALAGQGACTYIDSFGSDLCEHGNNDSWLPDWLEASVDEASCLALDSSLGCSWNAATSKCSQDPTNCVGADESACNNLASKGCYWKEAGACDPHDAMSCTATGTAFYTCTHTAWSNLIGDVLNQIDPFDPSTWNISAIVDEFVTRMKNGCVSKYLECFFLTECGSPQLVVTNICEDTVLKICEELGTSASDCPIDWCDVGVTQGSSLIDVALDFASDLDLDAFFTADKVEELRKTIEYIIGGKFNLDWIEFDKSTGKISITVPPNSIISQAEFDEIVEKLTNMLTGTSSSAMSNGFRVNSVAVTSQVATIDSSQAAWEGKKSEGGLSMVQLAGIGGACIGLVAVVVGAVVYGRRGAGGSSGGGKKPKQYGGKSVAMKGSGKKGSKGSKMMKGAMNMDSYV